jgi:hypothetical protein
MDPIQHFERHAAEARRDRPPLIDVTDAVMRDIDALSPAERRERNVLYAMTALSAVAAIVVAMITIGAYEQMTDPLIGLLSESSRIVQ